MTAADALDAKISALDAKELLQQADLADETVTLEPLRCQQKNVSRNIRPNDGGGCLRR